MKNSFKLRNLSIAALAGLASFGAGVNSAQAEETPVVQTLGEASAYTLTKLETEPSSITSNVITNYVYDEVSGSLNKEYYRYDLAKTEYGSGANTRYYKWVDGVMTRIETDANGNPLETPEITVKNPNSGACMWRPNNQTVNGHWYVDQNGSTLDGWGSTSSPFKSNVINSYFIESSATGVNGQTNHGGAIRGFSMSEYTGISGLFIGNHATASGGAIYNYVQYTYNPEDAYAIIGDINADFIGNYVNNTVGDFMEHGGGGAIFNSGIDGSGFNVEIGNITGNFIGNYVTSERLNVYGGAIQNQTAKIGDIKGDFVNNHITGTASGKGGYGGAIYNGNSHADKGAVIDSITGDFVGNYVKAGKYAHGGALYNGYDPIYLSNDKSSTVGSITGNFYNNYTKGNIAAGGAIYNTGYLPDINANFIGNYALATDVSYSYGSALGGAIYNSSAGVIDSVEGDFIGNHAGSGGAIHNSATIGELKSNFVGNYATESGGAIKNSGKINTIAGDFTSNYAESGGAILNDGTIETINSNFVGNYSASGGAIANQGYIKEINGNFDSNYVTNVGTNSVSAAGGAYISMLAGIQNPEIAIQGIGTNIKGDFTNNSAYSDDAMIVGGGAIMSVDPQYANYYGGFTAINGNLTTTISGDFINNSASNNGTYLSYYGENIGGAALGGAIWVNGFNPVTEKFEKLIERGLAGELNELTQEEVMELVQEVGLGYGAYGITVTNPDGTPYWERYVLGDDLNDRIIAESDEVKEKLQNGEILLGTMEEGMLSDLLMSWTLDDVKVLAESKDMTVDEYLEFFEKEFFNSNMQQYLWHEDPNKYYLAGLNAKIKTADDVRNIQSSITLENSNILNNHAESKHEGFESRGGAIYGVNATVNIKANDGETHYISGNYTKTADKVDDNAIYMRGGNLIFDVTKGSTIQLDDNVRGAKDYRTYIIGDENSKFILNNKLYYSNTHLFDTNLYLANDSNLDTNKLTLHSGMLSMINNQVGVSALNSMTVAGDTNVLVDVDLKNQTMDRFTASEYGSHSGNLNVTGMNLLSDAVSDTSKILFAEKGLKDNVTYAGKELPDSTYQAEVYSPIYKYNVSYDKSGENGYFVFSRGSSGGSSGGSSESFNPAVLGSSSATSVGATATMNQAFNYAFQHSADHMNIPYLERISMRDRNKYALSITGDATDMGRFSPLYQPSDEEASVWVKPYATFETVGLKNGPKVHNNTYGTLIGFDTQMQSIKRGWDRVFTGYIGYNGASQRYSGIDSTQNGGLLGGTMTLYKGNFFNATTVSVGASVANNQTMYGNEDFAMLLSGIGNKTGYNFEFKEGKLILQPSMLMSYTFVNTFDYTNAAGVRIDNKPLHALQLAPGVKVIGNLKGGWQPYASVQMVWNLMGESNATANGVKLPEMSIKPYVQYGVGVQKRIKDHFTAYGQAMVQNGGRNGVSLTAGFRWALGHDKCKYEEQKVERVKDKSKTLSLGEGANSSKKIIKQMTPQQRAAYGGKYYNTSRTAKSGSLRQY